MNNLAIDDCEETCFYYSKINYSVNKRGLIKLEKFDEIKIKQYKHTIY